MSMKPLLSIVALAWLIAGDGLAEVKRTVRPDLPPETAGAEASPPIPTDTAGRIRHQLEFIYTKFSAGFHYDTPVYSTNDDLFGKDETARFMIPEYNNWHTNELAYTFYFEPLVTDPALPPALYEFFQHPARCTFRTYLTKAEDSFLWFKNKYWHLDRRDYNKTEYLHQEWFQSGLRGAVDIWTGGGITASLKRYTSDTDGWWTDNEGSYREGESDGEIEGWPLGLGVYQYLTRNIRAGIGYEKSRLDVSETVVEPAYPSGDYVRDTYDEDGDIDDDIFTVSLQGVIDSSLLLSAAVTYLRGDHDTTTSLNEYREEPQGSPGTVTYYDNWDSLSGERKGSKVVLEAEYYLSRSFSLRAGYVWNKLEIDRHYSLKDETFFSDRTTRGPLLGLSYFFGEQVSADLGYLYLDMEREDGWDNIGGRGTISRRDWSGHEEYLELSFRVRI